MNILSKFFLSASALLMLAGCSDDLVKATGGMEGLTPDDNTPGVYIGVNFQMPGMGGTRSTTTDPSDDQSTSNTGVEVGQNYENNVNEVLLILARKADYGYIGSAKVQNDYIYKHTDSNSTSGNVGSYHANAKFEKAVLEDYYKDVENFDTEIAVFVVVNPNGGLENYLDDKSYGNQDWINQPWSLSTTAGVSEGAIWSTANGGNFLMTNSRIAIREIPSDFDAWELFSHRDTPFNLSENNDVEGTKYDIDNSATTDTSRGAVNVQRACARFDFRDGSNNNNTYTAIYLQNEDGTDNIDKPFIDVQLQRLSLVNMNSSFYYFERVSANGLPTDVTICGTEKRWYEGINGNSALYDPTGGNYVVDYFAEQKYNAIQNKMVDFKYSDYFLYPLFEDNGTINSVDSEDDITNDNVDLGSQSRWASTDISDILNNDALDNYDDDGATEYHIWRYVTENIIPFSAIPYDYYQPNGLTTGIVFRAKMIANEDLLVEAPEDENGNPDESLLSNEDRERNHIIKTINSNTLEVGVGDETGITDSNFTWKNPILYMYAKQLYATWNDMCEAAIEGSLEFIMQNGAIVQDWNRNNSLYMAVFGDGVTGCTIMYDTENNTYNVYGPGEKLPAAKKYIMFNDFNVPADIENLPYIVEDPNVEGGEKINEEKLEKLAAIPYNERGLKAGSANLAWQAWDAAGRPSNEDNGNYTIPGTSESVAKKALTAAYKSAVTEAGITIYQRSKENGEYGYYCYYYYWNRHNDNNRNGVMGPMEFCTVRNNVYKLSVSKVSRLGHPRLDENDPNTPKGDDPDESSDVYITVDAKVIPWVVRINEIEF